MTQQHFRRSDADITRSFAQNRKQREQAIRSGNWFQRAAYTMHDQVDTGGRSIPAIIATENPVAIYDRRSGRVMQEILVVAGAQLSDWVPMLDSHGRWSLRDNLGSVLDSKAVGREVRSVLKFAATEDVEPIWLRVRDGHLRAVSAGGRRLAFTDIEPGQSQNINGKRYVAGRLPMRVTSRWILLEASVVLFGADGGSATSAE